MIWRVIGLACWRTSVGVAGRGDIVRPEGVGFPDYAAARPGGTSVTWAVAWS